MVKWLYQLFIELTNHAWTSKCLASFTRSKWSRLFISSYAKVYKINKEEMEKKLHEYETLQQLFVRTLKKGLRPIDTHPDSVVSPVDAVIEDVGIITDQKEIIVKGKTYSIREMLGDDQIAEKYLHGTFIILYLSPSHYHRIHSPICGEVVKQWELGGKSYPVNRLGLKYGKAPLSKNYRRITELYTNGMYTAIVKVGAMFVNSIELTHEHDHVKKGEEIGYFSFGSTVVLLFEKDVFTLDEQIVPPFEVKMGQRIGFLAQKKKSQ
ncbi:phosphatidylserine decarboxylase [Anoxybacillus flavithermus]|uniref:Phosphatidylserine decarboxylase proenzyme n=1 Tax=Anoxybacillus flavithermus (strain DSM 21510 / WK1) TaxID=491915 RepID=PSD_ANOFW|nr:phosphatidylserine decarboxylase [Anoxybacillus flavithermus]B7GKA2.1 RecName: Full=Phosphatidylserine decarboxylase proenzyme; Contains: RecName: Full=Phosphatidylserine decarboxylase alpha chain; Contains: RecName: Full=Phosphatidylserine decarboxylase beta chain [Anoxybacillus flavithermus WK1]ACJ33187.1 Phosphatidylserine decarboxylase [Anoxybacillus flavithermus WK1]